MNSMRQNGVNGWTNSHKNPTPRVSFAVASSTSSGSSSSCSASSSSAFSPPFVPSSTSSNTAGGAAAASSSSSSSSPPASQAGNLPAVHPMYIVPSMATEIENILAEMGVQKYEERVVHMLVDILQRETLTILNGAAELAALRIQNAKENFLLIEKKKNKNLHNTADNCIHGGASMQNNSSIEIEDDVMIIQREDSELAVSEYMNKYVLHPSTLEDSMRLAATTNLLGVGEDADGAGAAAASSSSTSFSSSAAPSANFPIFAFPTSLGPYLPEDVNVNTIVPGWDLKVDEYEEEKEDMNNEELKNRYEYDDTKSKDNENLNFISSNNFLSEDEENNNHINNLLMADGRDRQGVNDPQLSTHIHTYNNNNNVDEINDEGDLGEMEDEEDILAFNDNNGDDFLI